jgi:CO/xanthine dehydrogenase FAD-binding subunit
VKPARFDYCAPTSVDDVLDTLRDRGPDAKLLAGGQSLVPLLNFRLSRPSVIVDLNRVPDFSYIREENGELAIGAMTRQRAIEQSEIVRRKAPLLWEATRHIAHLPIRTRGTIGGSLANNDPAAEDPAVAVALGCVMVLASRRGTRRVAAADFFRGLLATALEPDEMLIEVRVPTVPEATGYAFEEISRRRGDFALAGVAAQVTVGAHRAVEARLAACGVGAGPVRLTRAEASVARDGLTEKAIDAAAAAAAEEVSPSTDVHASADYRRKLVAAMTRRALHRAARRAGEENR